MRVISRTESDEGQISRAPQTTGASPGPEGEQRLSRRKFIRRGIALALAALGGGGCLVGTRRLVVERVEVRLRGLQSDLRLALISDTHMRAGGLMQLYTNEALVRKALDLVSAEKPDMFFFAGDLSATTLGGGKDMAFKLIDMMGGLDAPLGKFACTGNHDLGRGYSKAILDYYATSDVELLDGVWTTVETPAGPVSLGGVGYRWDSYEAAVLPEDSDRARPRIFLAHDPVAALYLEDHDSIDLMVCGHTHGGQIHLPWIGAPWVPSPAYPMYYRGLGHLTDKTKIYVTRGVGTVFLPIRFGARPEVSILDLKPLA